MSKKPIQQTQKVEKKIMSKEVKKVKKIEEIILNETTSKILKTLEFEARKYEIQHEGIVGKIRLIMSTYISAVGKTGNYQISEDYTKLLKVEEVKK